jgi:pimeloyl-ACP methyl ester carboxylesterase
VYQQVIKWDEVEKYVVVGHSIGSIPAIHLTKRQSDRVKGFVAVSSLLPGQGESFVSQLPFVKRVMLTTIIKLKGTKPPESIIKSLLCNDLKDDTAEMVAKSYVSESPYLFFDPSTYDLPTVPSLYIQTTRDQDTPPDLQQRMAEKLDNCSIDTIDTGHLPMLSKPDRLSMQFENFTKLL